METYFFSAKFILVSNVKRYEIMKNILVTVMVCGGLMLPVASFADNSESHQEPKQPDQATSVPKQSTVTTNDEHSPVEFCASCAGNGF